MEIKPIEIRFELTKKLKPTVERLEQIYKEAQQYSENSAEYEKLDTEFLILCDDLEVDAKMGARAGYISWNDVDTLLYKYQF